MRFAPALALLLVVAGCGLQVRSADLFVLERSGPGPRLTLLVNDGGTIRCNGGKAKTLPDPLLLDARQLASDLDKDAKGGLRVKRSANSVFSYRIQLQDGTIAFPDTAAAGHPELARAEQFALRAATGPCGLRG